MASKKNSVCVTGKFEQFKCKFGLIEGLCVCDRQEKDIGHFTCKLLCCNSCSFAGGLPQKKDVNPDIVQHPEANNVKDGHNSPRGRLHSSLMFPALSPTIISGYVNPRRKFYQMEALHALMQKNAVEQVTTEASLGFYNQLFRVPKLNNW